MGKTANIITKPSLKNLTLIKYINIFHVQDCEGLMSISMNKMQSFVLFVLVSG